jgi:hypothetical protein
MDDISLWPPDYSAAGEQTGFSNLNIFNSEDMEKRSFRMTETKYESIIHAG